MMPDELGMPGERRVAFGIGLGLLRRPVCVEQNFESTTISHRTAVSPVGTKPVVGGGDALLFGEIAVDEHSTVRAPAHRDLAPSFHTCGRQRVDEFAGFALQFDVGIGQRAELFSDRSVFPKPAVFRVLDSC